MILLRHTNMPDEKDLARYEKLFLALADQTRLRLLVLMADGPVAVGYLADQLNESQPKTSRHLGYLRSAGLVSTTREGKWVYYEVAEQPDRAIQRILRTTISCVTGQEDTPVRPPQIREEENISPHAYMSDWQPNELDVHLL